MVSSNMKIAGFSVCVGLSIVSVDAAILKAVLKDVPCSNTAYDQCGGKDFAGDTCCPPGHTCASDNDYWSACKPDGPAPSPSPPAPPAPSPSPAPEGPCPEGWNCDLTLTTFWDCNGMSCDSPIVQPYDYQKYVAPATYAPIKPDDMGFKTSHGETLWMVGAVTPELTEFLNNHETKEDQTWDLGCIDDTGRQSCGKCMLVQHTGAINSDWKVIVMKKSKTDNGSQSKALDLAVPGFEFGPASDHHDCNKPKSPLSDTESSIAGGENGWWSSAKSTNDATILDRCNSIRDEVAKKGCLNFAEWGWDNRIGNPGSSGDGVIHFQVVDCPQDFVDYVKKGFSPDGICPTDEQGHFTNEDGCNTDNNHCATR